MSEKSKKFLLQMKLIFPKEEKIRTGRWPINISAIPCPEIVETPESQAC